MFSRSTMTLGIGPHSSMNMLTFICYISHESKTTRNVLWSHASVCVSVCLSVCLSVTLVYCGQTVGCIKMKFVVEVGLSPNHIVLDGDLASLPLMGDSPPQFSTHVCADVPLRNYSLTHDPCLLWPRGWLDRDATWYGGRRLVLWFSARTSVLGPRAFTVLRSAYS